MWLFQSLISIYRKRLLWIGRSGKDSRFSSDTQSCLTLCNPVDCSTPGFLVHHQLRSLLKLMSIKSVMPSNHLILCGLLLLLPSVFPQLQGLLTSQFFTSGGQSIGASASASVLPMSIVLSKVWYAYMTMKSYS